MAGQERVQPSRRRDEPIEPPPADPTPQGGERTARIDADIDAVLDEIDGVLEANAEEFVAGFVQKGGQ